MKFTAQLRSTVDPVSKDRNWHVMTDHPQADNMGNGVTGVFPKSSGDASLVECGSWLKTRGFREDGEQYPESCEYTCELINRCGLMVTAETAAEVDSDWPDRYFSDSDRVHAAKCANHVLMVARKHGYEPLVAEMHKV